MRVPSPLLCCRTTPGKTWKRCWTTPRKKLNSSKSGGLNGHWPLVLSSTNAPDQGMCDKSKSCMLVVRRIMQCGKTTRPISLHLPSSLLIPLPSHPSHSCCPSSRCHWLVAQAMETKFGTDFDAASDLFDIRMACAAPAITTEGVCEYEAKPPPQSPMPPRILTITLPVLCLCIHLCLHWCSDPALIPLSSCSCPALVLFSLRSALILLSSPPHSLLIPPLHPARILLSSLSCPLLSSHCHPARILLLSPSHHLYCRLSVQHVLPPTPLF